MEDANVNEFRRCVMNGDFTNIKEPMKKLNMSQEQLKHIEYQLYEQQYLEMMENGLKIEAIKILQ
ncbi:MAG: hypothetical protein ACMG6E_05985 [Candidatus Roizmanbacteria bacterium]